MHIFMLNHRISIITFFLNLLKNISSYKNVFYQTGMLQKLVSTYVFSKCISLENYFLRKLRKVLYKDYSGS